MHKLRWMALVLLAGLVLNAGCTRRYYRDQADREVGQVLAEKDRFDFWRITNYHVYPNPRARFADVTNPDRPPMPPDDPAARDVAPNPQRSKRVAWVEGEGYLELLKLWDATNRARRVAANLQTMPEAKNSNSIKQASLRQPADPRAEILPAPRTAEIEGYPGRVEHPFLITLEQAVELGLINSREFQSRREDLYLAALPVTFQRFSFAAQFLATERAIRQYSGRLTPEGRRNIWDLNTTAGLGKLFSTGALLLLQFANQTVIDLGGNLAKPVTSVSTLNLDLVQPLLRGGGRAVTLEPLTQSERDLLYEIRGFARFRKQFFVNLATGGDFDVFNAQPVRQGYLPALLRSANFEIDTKNLAEAKKIQRLIEIYEEGGQVTPLQVAQARSQVLQAERSRLRSQQDVQDALDRFKLQLGLPVNIHLQLDDSPIREIANHLNDYEQIIAQMREIIERVDRYDEKKEGKTLRAKLEEEINNAPFLRGTDFQVDFLARWQRWKKQADLEPELQRMRQQRRNLFDARDLLADLLPENGQSGDPAADVYRLLAAVLAIAQKGLERDYDIGSFEQVLTTYEKQPWLKIKEEPLRKKEQANRFQYVIEAFSNVLVDALDERTLSWSESWPEPPPVVVDGLDLLAGVDIEPAYSVGTRVALTNRVDLMNQRAQVVDAWRQVAVQANSLLGVFNVEYHLEGSSPAGQAKPLAVTGSRVKHQLVLDASLPLVRRAERNDYRAALIGYQRSRRELMRAEDGIASTIRQEIRQLRQLAENYKIQQKAVELAYRQLDAAYEALKAPPGGGPIGAAGQVGAPTQGSAANAAALTNQLLQSQDRLFAAQSQLYTFWVNYQINRYQLFRDLELMPLDFRGVWIDECATRKPVREPRHDDIAAQPVRVEPVRVESAGEPGPGPGEHQRPRLLAPTVVLPETDRN